MLNGIKAFAAPRPLFVGETGYSTDETPGDQAAQQQAQAAYYRAVFAAAAALDRPPRRRGSSTTSRREASRRRARRDEPAQYGYGLFQLNGTPKQAAAVVRRAFSGN